MRLPSRRLVIVSLLAVGLAGWAVWSVHPRFSPADSAATTAAVGRQQPRTISTAPQALLPRPGDPVTDWREFIPDEFSVQLTPALEVPFRVTKVERQDGRTVLTARVTGSLREQAGLEGAFLVGTSNGPDRWDATVVFPGMEYRIRVRGDEVSVEEAPNEELICLTDQPPTAAVPTEASAPEIALAADANTPTVDVLVLVNQQALAERNNDLKTIDADCSNYIAASNAVLENSRVTAFVWRYLTVLQAPAYTTGTILEDDLVAMRTGALATHIAGLRPVYGADQVMLLAGGIKTDAAGWAYIGGSRLATINYPFPTFSNGTRSTVTTSYFTFCHELAHNFGCRHSRANSDSNATDGDGRYYYGHRFTDPLSTARPAETVGTVMATGASYRIPYFSNPEISYRGVPIGVAVDQPTAAHNARFLAEGSAAMVATAESVAAPAIVRQPQGVQVSAGQSATLSVTATGNGLSYSWARNGSTVANATSATLTLAAVTSNEAGTYTVTISNVRGSVTSDPAVVSLLITTTTSATTTTPASSSSGGGGGSVSLWALAALAALAGLRHVSGASRRG